MDRAKLLLDQLREGLTKGYVEEMPGFINFDYCDPTTRVDDHTLEIPTDEGTFVVTIKLKEGTAPPKLKVTVINTDGTSAEHDYPRDLAGWQALVGGPIEQLYVTLPPNESYLLILNEEGRLKNLPYNARVSDMIKRSTVGPVVLLTGEARLRWELDE